MPIIAPTAFAMNGDEEIYLDEGFDDYISKPVNIEFLQSKIQQIKNGQKIRGKSEPCVPSSQ